MEYKSSWKFPENFTSLRQRIADEKRGAGTPVTKRHQRVANTYVKTSHMSIIG